MRSYDLNGLTAICLWGGFLYARFLRMLLKMQRFPTSNPEAGTRTAPTVFIKFDAEKLFTHIATFPYIGDEEAGMYLWRIYRGDHHIFFHKA